MRLARRLYSKLDTFTQDIKIVSPSGESVTVDRIKGNWFTKLLTRFSGRFRRYQSNNPILDVFACGKKIGELTISQKSEDELNLCWLEIDKSLRGQGYAQALLTGIIKFAKENKFKEVTLEVPGHSPDARHIYEKLGFKAGKVLTTPEEDWVWDGLTEMKLKLYSGRDIVPAEIAKEGKESGVVQKDSQGRWRIISYKTNPPEFWNAHYSSKEDAMKALEAYHANHNH